MRSLLLAMALTSAAPEFPHHAADDWINSPPLALKDLSGKVVVVEFWTFACSNCARSVPWINSVYDKYEGRGLQIIGVHTPELAHERIVANVRRKVEQYGIRFPVMIDGDYAYWNAWENQYWPAFYLVDKRGQVRVSYFGETHANDAQAKRIEADIERLLSEGA
jgi:thiol-disulfide isomerase/thioredoxin